MKPKISIIIPVYHTEKFLKRCLDSCLCQTMEEIEIIVINDASPDNSDQIMRQYEQEYPDKVTCIYLKENIRQGGARNIGLRHAKGEFVLFVDSDDWIDSKMCEELYQKSVEEHADIVYCNVLKEKEDGTVISNRFPWELTGIVDESKVRLLIMQLFVGPWAHIIKREIILENKLFFPERVIYEDMVITRMWDVYAEKIAKIDKPYYRYCLNMESVGHIDMPVYRDDGFNCIELLNKELKTNPKTEKFQTEREIICLRNALDMADGMMKKNGGQFADRIQSDFLRCVNKICRAEMDKTGWKYWFCPAEINWIEKGLDSGHYKACFHEHEIEKFRAYYKTLRQEIEAVMTWFLRRGKVKKAVWAKTDYTAAFLKEWEDCCVIDCTEEAQNAQIDYILALRSVHCENIKHHLRNTQIEIFNLQGYLLGGREITEYIETIRDW